LLQHQHDALDAQPFLLQRQGAGRGQLVEELLDAPGDFFGRWLLHGVLEPALDPDAVLGQFQRRLVADVEAVVVEVGKELVDELRIDVVELTAQERHARLAAGDELPECSLALHGVFLGELVPGSLQRFWSEGDFRQHAVLADAGQVPKQNRRVGTARVDAAIVSREANRLDWADMSRGVARLAGWDLLGKMPDSQSAECFPDPHLVIEAARGERSAAR